MKTTIAIVFSVLLIFPGIKKSDKKSENDIRNVDLHSLSIPNLDHDEGIDLSKFTYNKAYPVVSEKVPVSKWIDYEKEMEEYFSIEEWMKSSESWIKESGSEINKEWDSYIFGISEDKHQEIDPLIEKWMTEPQKWTERNR